MRARTAGGRQGRVGALIRAVGTRTCGPVENPTRESWEGSFLTVFQGTDEKLLSFLGKSDREDADVMLPVLLQSSYLGGRVS